ncbi:ABC transporter ATP-binding protein [Microvirga guangxiensis]|uniref:Amino acid/amide ABC transporter ATP-binding protein 2, HAAT family n=1 Tax=Microvirga guangxiensis TaxID=549386 RepID=A0A1G5F1M2_9HYPH|nr:ABC transporter ATP-binding protein [Microvirga guangxiensis]SCY33107.1 amino acid/amide ABC transporter ATP-binding protein 2, HAAT family [Microvirga guangxiensis]
MTALLELRNVVAGYGAARILHDLNLSIGEGERVSVIGRNGVGKTTIVNTLLGTSRFMGGEVLYRGRALPKIAGHTAATCGIAVVPQGRKILPNLTVAENLRLGAALGRKGRWTIDEIYRLFPILHERRNSSGTALSGGQQQMIAIGRALMANPDLLILDEPCEGLAPVIVDEISAIFKNLAATGVGILLIEQHLNLVREITDRFYVISKGSVVRSGHVASVSQHDLQTSIMQ